MAGKPIKGPTEIQMTKISPKKHSVRYDAGVTDDPPVSSIYVSKAWVDANGGCPKGVRITLEKIH